ncbi:MAG: enoyl-ACP reductase FabV [Spirochaetia bacterium]|jgi:enoyl-[acyl-carrier protein] reductase/trans-2-enoyl-CoA reductase (NAD+)
MRIERRIRGAICLSVHPHGCEEHVREQIAYIKSRPALERGPRKVLIIGASTGYGLASRITAAFGNRADTVGIFYERPADDDRTASAGWYNSAFFEEEAAKEGLKAWSLNGDAFTEEVKTQTLDLVRKRTGPVDLVVYSLAAPRRGEFTSALRPLGKSFTSKTVNFQTGQVYETTVPPATEEEIRGTVAVMGGEDWKLWMDALRREGLLAKGAVTVAYSYIGAAPMAPIYRSGTIGKAKEHLEATAREMDRELAAIGGRALVSVNKAVVTLASAAIPFVPLYIAILYKVMKDMGNHEGCIEQMDRLFRDRLYTGGPIPVDEMGRIRLDERELEPAVQDRVQELFQQVSTENLQKLTDFEGYRKELARICGFDSPGVNYTADIDPRVRIPSLT